MLAEKNEFCAHGAPKFRKFCNSFAKFLRNFYMISTSDAHFFGSEQIYDFIESFSDVTRVVNRTLAECTQFSESKENHEKHRREKNHFNEAAVDPKYKKGPHERREKGNKLH